jgi:hypothetical protein
MIWKRISGHQVWMSKAERLAPSFQGLLSLVLNVLIFDATAAVPGELSLGLTSCNDESMRYYPNNERLRYISAIYRTNESGSAAK